MQKSGNNDVKGMKVGRLFFSLMIVVCLVCISVFLNVIYLRNEIGKLINFKDQYNQCDNFMTDLQYSSTNLTQLSRAFAETQELEYMSDYFDAVEAFKDRSNYISLFRNLEIDVNQKQNLQIAMEDAENLMAAECYSMKLICAAANVDSFLIPAEIQKIALNPEDELLSEAEMLEKANSMLFDENYIFLQMDINEKSRAALTEYLENNQSVQAKYQLFAEHGYIFLIVNIIALFILAVLIYVIFVRKLYIPLRKCVVNIENGTKIALKGSYEMQYIEAAYNTLCDKNQLTASVLKHKAEHDPLTGLINREGFEQIKKALSDSGEAIAYLLIDIDLFKHINDQYGHAIGDDVLRKISNLFMEQFRGSDYVARIGGDEFAIIMTKFGISPMEIINAKIQRLNFMLQNNSDGLPPVSLSVGVAISEKGYYQDLERRADKALYIVKEGGRCNCSFYKD